MTKVGITVARAARGFVCAAGMAAILLPRLAAASLGGTVDSVEVDRRALHGSSTTAMAGAYQVHQLSLPSGTTLKEFVAPNGTVFAVAWRGPRVPDLQQALGTYFDRYSAAVKVRSGGHNHFELRQTDLVVQAGGHMRAFVGRAYLPSAIPAGVSLADLHS
jgi:hypothetical protein